VTRPLKNSIDRGKHIYVEPQMTGKLHLKKQSYGVPWCSGERGSISSKLSS